MQAAISNSDMDDATKVESAKAVSGMQTNAMTPDQMASVLLSEMAVSKFYVIGFDAGQPKEMLHAMLQWRVDDIRHCGGAQSLEPPRARRRSSWEGWQSDNQRGDCGGSAELAEGELVRLPSQTRYD